MIELTVVTLYTARIFEFFVKRLCSGLWSGCFSFLFLSFKRFLEQQSYSVFFLNPFLSIRQGVRLVTFVQDANLEEQPV